jgi:hypothetical protein
MSLMSKSELRAGDWVEIKSKEEILQTLDKRGQLDGLPFMPCMFQFCGKRMRVYKRAHKGCDTVSEYKNRRMKAAVHLENARCDGSSHGGCDALCLLYWKEAWLTTATEKDHLPITSKSGSGCSEADVWAGTRVPGCLEEDVTYVCQATQLPAATERLPWWDARQYVEDLASGNVGLWQFLKGSIYACYYNLSRAGIGLGPIMRWLYDVFQSAVGGVPYPRKTGTIPVGQRTPTCDLDLQEGELVRVKPYDAILATLDTNNKNRGLYFDAEVVPFCGGTYRVIKRVNRIINEKTGKMIKLKAAVILENVFCQARYSYDRMFCPRAIYQYMREIWLERVGPTPGNKPDSEPAEMAETRG